MRIATFFFIGVALAFLVSTPAVAQEETEAPSIDMTGQWEFQSESPRGTRTSRITFEQDGAKLEGYTEIRDQRVPLSGTVKGNEFEFTINLTMGDRSMQITYTGTVDGDTAEGTIETMRGSNPFTARRLS